MGSPLAQTGISPHQLGSEIIDTEPRAVLRDWRSKVLDRLLPIAALAMLPAIGYIVLSAALDPEISRTEVIIELVIYAALVFITIFRGLGPERRIWVMMALVYLIGVAALWRGGLAGDGRTYLLTLPVLAILLIDTRAGIFYSLLSLLTYIFFAYLAQAGVLAPALVYQDNPLTLDGWLLNGLTLATLIGLMLFISRSATVFQLKALKRVEQTASQLAEANRRLEETNRGLEQAVAQRTAELRQANQHLAQLAMHDSLTGLPNRNLLFDRLQQSIRLGQRRALGFALFYIDLDHFKEINDTYGHEMGDRALRAVAGTLTHSFRDSDTVARLGGDEFVVLMNDIQTLQSVERVAQVLLDGLARPLRLSGTELQISASIGISLFPDHGTDPETLLKKADAAMYAVKDCGKNCFQIYQADH